MSICRKWRFELMLFSCLSKTKFKHQNQTTIIGKLCQYLCYFFFNSQHGSPSVRLVRYKSPLKWTEPVTQIDDIMYCIWQVQWWLGLTHVTPGNGAPLKAPLVSIFGLMNYRLSSVSPSIRFQHCVQNFVYFSTLFLTLESWSVSLLRICFPARSACHRHHHINYPFHSMFSVIGCNVV